MKIRVRVKFLLLHIFLVVVAVFAAVYITFLWLDSYTRHGESVVVPDVEGLYHTAADVALAEQKMKAVIVDSMFIEGRPGGVVVDQVPSAGSRVKEGRSIYLTINSLYPRKVEMPELVDLSYRQAEAVLSGLGFAKPHIVYWNSEYKDLVLSVSVSGLPVLPGDKLPLTSQLTLAVGNGIYAPTRRIAEAPDTAVVDTTLHYDEIFDAEY